MGTSDREGLGLGGLFRNNEILRERERRDD